MALTDKLTDFIIHFPYRIMVAGLILAATMGAGVNYIYLNSGIEIFFAEDDPNLIAERALKATYGREDNILFVLDSGPATIFNRANLKTVEEITEKSWKTPHSRRVDSLNNYLHPTIDGDEIAIQHLISDVEDLSDTDIANIKSIALKEATLVGRLLSSDGEITAINVNLQLPETEREQSIAESVQFAREVAAEAQQHNPDLEIHLTGWAVLEQTLVEVTTRDSTTLMPVLFALVLATLALLLRSMLASLCTVIVIALSIMIGMGYAGWVGYGINSINVSAPTIIMTLAIADCIHLLTAFLMELRRSLDKRAALSYSLRHTMYPIALTSITTAIGFLSMNFSESPPFQELGTISAIGVIGALIITVTVLPGLILLLPFRANASRQTGVPMSGLAEFVVRHSNALFWVSGGAIIICLTGVFKIELNDDPGGYFSENVPITRAINLVESRLSGTQSLHYSLQANAASGILEPDFLLQVDRFANWLRAQPEVVNVEVFTDVLKRLNQVMHGDAPDWKRLPESRELAAQYTLLYEISVPYGQDVTNQVTADKSAIKLSATLKNQKSQGLIAFEDRAQDWMLQNTPGIHTRGAGQSVSFAHVGVRNIQSMLYGSLFAIILICGCLIIAFRSVKYGLISFIPNLFPAFVTLGIWGALVSEVNIAASVVFSLTLGIIVDDTTHFLVNYLEGRRTLGLSAADAIRRTFCTVGNALVSTSIVLAIGFLVLVQSDFSVNATTGLLVAMTITIAIVLDLFFLPSVLMKADRLLMGTKNRVK